jgi:phospholipid N-methyltransferase
VPTLDWLKNEFAYGYDSGNVLSWLPNLTRYREEKAIGGSYRRVFWRGLAPYLKSDVRVLELGPGRGSWSRAILSLVTKGELHTVDYVDVSKWLEPSKYGGRLVCHQVVDNSFSELSNMPPFDVFWSFGVLCHNNLENIETILVNARSKMKPGAVAIHQYGDWKKLDKYGWKKGRVPIAFKDKPDADIWWPRNDKERMSRAAIKAGWEIETPDIGLLARDSMIVLRNPIVKVD